MTDRTIYTHWRGATILIQRQDSTAAEGLEGTVTARLRRYAANSWEVTPDSDVSGNFAVTFRAAAGDVAAGWDFTLDASESALLEPGWYQFDYATDDGGTVTVSDPPASVWLKEAASLD